MNFNNLTGEIIDPIKEQSTFNEFTNFLTRNKGTISIIIALSLVLILAMVLALCLWKRSKKTSAVVENDKSKTTSTDVGNSLDANVDINGGAIADLEAKLKNLEGDDWNNYLNNDIKNINDLNKIQSELNAMEFLKTDLNEAKNKISSGLEESLKNRFDTVNAKLNQISQALNNKKEVIEEANRQAERTAKTITSVHVRFINDNILKDTKRQLNIINDKICIQGTAATNFFNNIEEKKTKIANNINAFRVTNIQELNDIFVKMATNNGTGNVQIILSDDEKKAIVAFCNDPKMHPTAQVATSGVATQVASIPGAKK